MLASMSSADEPDLQLILFKRRNGQFRLAPCRGANKGCDKIRRDHAPKKPCPDCVLLEDETETIGHVRERLLRGDA